MVKSNHKEEKENENENHIYDMGYNGRSGNSILDSCGIRGSTLLRKNLVIRESVHHIERG